MMDGSKVSVIVPVYNVENYLKRCLVSIMDQTYTDLEIILVDDGSTDRSSEICDEYASNDPRFKVIHKSNGGLSSARNAGISAATGDYLSFVDSDDHPEPDMISSMIECMSRTGADLCICGCNVVDGSGNVTECELRCSLAVEEQLTSYEAQQKLTLDEHWYYSTAWNKICKAGLFEDLRFEEGRLHEDEFIVHKLFDRCSKVSVIPDKLYNYTVRRDSITGRSDDIAHLDLVCALIDRYEFYKIKYPDLRVYTYLQVYYQLIKMLRKSGFGKWPDKYRSVYYDAERILRQEKEVRRLTRLRIERMIHC